MATLHLMIGLPCSGKTIRARELADEHHALLLTPDVWHVQLFGQDIHDADHDRRHGAIEAIMWDVAARVLPLGVDVILDFGCWAREEREDFRSRAARAEAAFRLHFMDVPSDELYRRLDARNGSLPPGVFAIPRSEMARYMAIFEPPGLDELV